MLAYCKHFHACWTGRWHAISSSFILLTRDGNSLPNNKIIDFPKVNTFANDKNKDEEKREWLKIKVEKFGRKGKMLPTSIFFYSSKVVISPF